MMMASPFASISTPLVAFLAIWASAITISCQEDGQTGRVRPVDPVEFLLSEGQPVNNKVAPLPYDINLNCELIFGIQIKPFVPRKQDEDDYDYEDSAEENNIEPAREAGEVIFTLKHPNFEDYEEEILVAVDENGNGLKKETVCFKHCANITDNKGFTLSANTDLKSKVDIKLVQEKGNHQCQKDKIVVKYNTTTITITSILGVSLFLNLLFIVLLAIECRRKRNINEHNNTNAEKQGDTEMASLKVESETSPPASRNMKRGLPSQVAEEVKEKSPGVKGFVPLGDNKEQRNDWLNRKCNRYSFLLIATFVSFLFTFIFAVLTALDKVYRDGYI